MAAGVPIKAPSRRGSPWAWLRMAIIMRFLTDIQGMEDHFGDMDFKVAGTKKPASPPLQMDIKIDGLNREILKEALAQARIGRLGKSWKNMFGDPSLSQERPLGTYAPKIVQLKIPAG